MDLKGWMQEIKKSQKILFRKSRFGTRAKSICEQSTAGRHQLFRLRQHFLCVQLSRNSTQRFQLEQINLLLRISDEIPSNASGVIVVGPIKTMVSSCATSNAAAEKEKR